MSQVPPIPAAAPARRRGSIALALVIAGVLSLTSCGSHQMHSRSRSPSRSGDLSAASVASASTSAGSAGSSAPPLVSFNRVVGFDPLASQLTVYENGTAVALITLGGVSGQHKQMFTMPAATLRRLRQLIGHARLRDTGCCDVGFYIYRVIVGGHAWRLQQGQVPRRLRPLINDLNAIIEAHLNVD